MGIRSSPSRRLSPPRRKTVRLQDALVSEGHRGRLSADPHAPRVRRQAVPAGHLSVLREDYRQSGRHSRLDIADRPESAVGGAKDDDKKDAKDDEESADEDDDDEDESTDDDDKEEEEEDSTDEDDKSDDDDDDDESSEEEEEEDSDDELDADDAASIFQQVAREFSGATPPQGNAGLAFRQASDNVLARDGDVSKDDFRVMARELLENAVREGRPSLEPIPPPPAVAAEPVAIAEPAAAPAEEASDSDEDLGDWERDQDKVVFGAHPRAWTPRRRQRRRSLSRPPSRWPTRT